MNSYYYKFLKELSELNFENKVCEDDITKNLLDSKLVKIISASKEVTQLQSLLADTEHIPKSLFEKALYNLKQQQNKIIDFYEKWFEEKKIMGDHKAYENPDIIIVLGCNRTMLNLRVECAIKYLKIHPNAIAILSGGGFSTVNTESDYMLELVKKSNIKNKTLQEETSMDTLGNAFFTKLLLKNKNFLVPNLKLLLITSDFHAYRSLHYFNTIYKNSGPFKIAVRGIKTANKNLRDLALHELLTEYQTESTIDIFGMDKNQVDDTAILIKLFQHHNLYKNRYDILRKFMNTANKELW